MSNPCTHQQDGTGSPTNLRHVAVVDPGSSVLPFDYYFCRSLIDRGERVTLLASHTQYNVEFLSELAREDKAHVELWRISSTVVNRAIGILNYLRMLTFLLVNLRKFDVVYYNFPKGWLLESIIFRILGHKAVFCIHNAVPHGFEAKRHLGTRALASSAHRLLFVSAWTKSDFVSRYGPAYENLSDVMQHGIIGIDPLDSPQSYQLCESFCGVAFWGNIKPYKGVEVFRLLPKDWLPKAVDKRYLIAGKWDHDLSHLRDEYKARNEIDLHDGFLTRESVKDLLAQDYIFLLPYRQASQSGILYTLLFYGRYFIGTDRGDIGDFLRTNGLEKLIIDDLSEGEMRRAIGWLMENLSDVQAKLVSAQQSYTWQWGDKVA